MIDEQIKKKEIESALAKIPDGDFLETSKDLLAVLGYRSQRTLKLSGNVDDFIQKLPAENEDTETEREFRVEAESVELVFQVTDDEIADSQQVLFEAPAFDKGMTKSFMFFVVELKEKDYPRNKYAQFTREVNKRIIMPVVVLFCVKSSCHPLGRVKNRLTIGFVGRRPHKRKPERNVLEQVTLIKDIDLNNSHRAHLDILFELSLEECAKWMGANNQPENFDGLLAAWLARLDTEELNKQFYRKLFDWFEWAVSEAKFPTNEKRVLKPEEHVIRLITRLLFVWFIKEKGLIAEELFNETHVSHLLKDYDHASGDSYYRAVLQNLFFATLNTEVKKRQFSTRTNAKHRNFSLYRYKNEISRGGVTPPLLELFAQTPFINGGLFDCLDSEEGTGDGGYRIDCFSDVHYKKLSVPNRLFFDDDHGLIPLLKHYKFTVQENTPIEQEVALDPELLGKVFENLLAAYNPETGATARKQTGSYYTPRPIVDYMVEEALVATLAQQVSPTDGDAELWEEQLRYLFDYAMAFDNPVGVGSPNPSPNPHFDSRESDDIVRAISALKILDPAVGSGAFPMGVLHKLTLALSRLDPNNKRWEQLQKERALKRAADAFDTKDRQRRDEELKEISRIFENYSGNFGRKLYLIQNSIFGLDVQSIACQIAKLRFFISLAIEQEPDATTDNLGIKPLPNLETRFIAGNTLIGLESERTLTSPKAKALETKLGENRERHFHATTRSQKRACKSADSTLRRELAKELKAVGMPSDDAEKIADWDPYDQNASADWFDPEWMFGVADGFDVVIGNPPYIRVQSLEADIKKLYSEYYESAVSGYDVYVVFVEKGLDLLNDNGHLAYILPHKFFNAKYGEGLRGLIARGNYLRNIVHFGDQQLFEGTTNYTCLLFLDKGGNNDFRFIKVNDVPAWQDRGAAIEGMVSAKEVTSAEWNFVVGRASKVFDKLRNMPLKLADVSNRIYQGLITSADKIFLFKKYEIGGKEDVINIYSESLKEWVQVESEVLKPVIRSGCIHQYRARPSAFVLFPYEVRNRSARLFSENEMRHNYPLAWGYLSGNRTVLETREKGKFKDEQWYRFGRTQNLGLWEQPKLMIPYMITELSAYLDQDDNYYFINVTTGGYGITIRDSFGSLAFLCGLLNSRLLDFYFKQVSTNFRSGYFAASKQYIEQLPMPSLNFASSNGKAKHDEIVALVERVLSIKKCDYDSDTNALEEAINQQIYSLYDLMPDEIAIVEDTSE